MSRLPNHLPRPPGELEALERVWELPRGWRSVTAVNNTYIGKLYIALLWWGTCAQGVIVALLPHAVAVSMP